MSVKKEGYKKIWNIAKLILAVVLIFIVFSKTSFAQIKLLIQDLNYTWGVIAILWFVSVALLKAFEYYVLLGEKDKFKNIFRIVVWQNAISNLIANIAGIASYMTMLKAEQKVKLSRSATVFIIIKMSDLVAACIYLVVASSIFWQQIIFLHWLIIALLAGTSLLFVVFIFTVIQRERFVYWLESISRYLKISNFLFVQRGFDLLRALAAKPFSITATLKKSMVLSLAYMSISMAFSYSTVRMFTDIIGWWQVVFVASIMQFVSFVPIQVFGGLGVAEMTAVYLYSILGINESKISAIMIGIRVVFYLMHIFMLLYLSLDVLRQNLLKKD